MFPDRIRLFRQRFDHLPPVALLQLFLVAQRRRLRADHALPVDPDYLGNHKPFDYRDAQKRQNRVARAEADGKVHVILFDEIGHQHLRHLIECHTERLEALGRKLGVQLAEDLGGVLAMRARRIQKLQGYHLSPEAAQQGLMPVIVLNDELRRRAENGGHFGPEEKGGGKNRHDRDKAHPQDLLMLLSVAKISSPRYWTLLGRSPRRESTRYRP